MYTCTSFLTHLANLKYCCPLSYFRYRAKVERVDGGNVQVLYIDFGNVSVDYMYMYSLHCRSSWQLLVSSTDSNNIIIVCIFVICFSFSV